MKTKLKFKDITPKNAIVVAILTAVVVAVVWLLWNKIAKALDAAKAEKKLKEEASQYGGKTLTDSQISSLAVQLYNAFKPSFWNWGTNEKVVERVLSRLGNNADYAALRVAYAAVNKDPKTDMDSRIDYEGKESEKAHWRSILDAKGIDIYTF